MQQGAARLWGPGRCELTTEDPHHETVNNTAVGTTEQKAHIPMGLGTWQECTRTTGHTSENFGSPGVRA